MNTAFTIYYEKPSTNPAEPRQILAASETKREAYMTLADIKKTWPTKNPAGFGITTHHIAGDAFEHAQNQIGKTI